VFTDKCRKMSTSADSAKSAMKTDGRSLSLSPVPVAEAMDSVERTAKKARVARTDTAEDMYMLLTDASEGPLELSTYYIKIKKGPGLKKSVYKILQEFAAANVFYFETVNSETFNGLIDEDDDDFDQLVEDFALFIKTQMIPANRLGTGLTTLPNMSLVKFVVSYTVE